MTLCEMCPNAEFFWSVFSRIWIEYGEIECISPYSVRMRENTDQKKLGIWTLFTQCHLTEKCKSCSVILDPQDLFVVRCTIWYHLHNLKNIKNTHGGVSLLVKLQTSACNFTKRNTPPRCFSCFLNCTNGTKSRNVSHFRVTKQSELFSVG